MANMKMDNAREPEQLRIMEEHAKAGHCHFCPEGFKSHKAPVVLTSRNWFVVANDFPYKGTRYHYLIVSRRHVTSVTDLDAEAFAELFNHIKQLAMASGVAGFSIFGRSGDMNFTGATLDHLHFHFISGGPKPEGCTLDDNILVTVGHMKK
jgi:diadenosine tetraphosphate (Ap4A) HIT family hydrolase